MDKQRFSYNDLEKRFQELNHRIEFSQLFKERFLEPFKEKTIDYSSHPIKAPTFQEFQQSRKKMSVKEYVDKVGMSLEDFEAPFVYTYNVLVYIEVFEAEKYLLLLDRSIYEANNEEELMKLEKLLYEFCIEEGIFD